MRIEDWELRIEDYGILLLLSTLAYHLESESAAYQVAACIDAQENEEQQRETP